LFRDRQQAGRLLADALEFLRNDRSVVVLAIPRGGVVVAKEVADAIGAPLDVIIARKLGAPGNPELAVGAVTQDGEAIPDTGIVRMLQVSDAYLKQETAKQCEEIGRRMRSYRGDRAFPGLEGKIVVIVDDGIATGSTVRAAIQSVKRRRAARVILAVPVGPRETISELSKVADSVVCLGTPEPFYAIGEFYDEFGQVEDETVRAILGAARTPEP
jgi:predicted phosphoribosyltransferase